MRLVPIVLVVALLAGCMDAPEAQPEGVANASVVGGAPHAPALDANASVDVPAWSVGDAWVVETRFGEETAESTLVVVSAGSDAYVVATTDEQAATFDAAFDVSYLGRIRAGDLAGAQQGQPVRFFDFPLSHGKSWTATWDGLQVSLSAAFVPDIATPAGKQPGFAISGAGPDGKEYVTYDYVPALGWWSHLDFAEGYGFTVKAAKRNWTGAYFEGSAKALLALGTAAPVGSTPAGSFTVDKDQTTVLLTLIGRSAQAHARGLVLVDPNLQAYNPQDASNVNAEPGASSTFTTAFLPPTAGQWQVAAPALHDPDGSFHLTVQQIALVQRTL